MKNFTKQQRIIFWLCTPISVPVFIFMAVVVAILSLLIITPYVRVPFLWGVWMFDKVVEEVNSVKAIWKGASKT